MLSPERLLAFKRDMARGLGSYYTRLSSGNEPFNVADTILHLLVSSVCLLVSIVASSVWWHMVLALFCGISFYILLEYATHRWVLHYFEETNHKQHHYSPDKEEDSAQKFWAIVVFLLGGAALWAIVSPAFACGFAASASWGWLWFGFVHHTTHASRDYESALFKKLKKHHNGHHCVRANCNYSVIFPPIDRWFGTALS